MPSSGQESMRDSTKALFGELITDAASAKILLFLATHLPPNTRMKKSLHQLSTFTSVLLD